MKKSFIAIALVASLSANSVYAGGTITPAPATKSDDGARDILIGAVVIGLLIWAFSGNGGSTRVSSKSSTTDAAKSGGRVIQKF